MSTTVYRFVIDDVITNVRRDFEDMGVDETIMHELQRSWETKIAQSRVTTFQAPEPTAAVEAYSFEEPTFEQPASAPVPAQPQASTPVASAPAPTPASAPAPAPTAPGSTTYTLPPPTTFTYRGERTPAASLANIASSTLPGDNSNAGRPQPHVAPRSNAGANSNSISLPGGGKNGTTDSSNSNIPQTDGGSDVVELMTREELDAYVEKKFLEAREAEQSTGQAPGEMTFTLTLSDRAARRARRDGLEGFSIGQVDGEDDEEDDTGLGSDLDDSDGDMDDESDNIVLCQYDKVSRTKSKWKCVLKDGIMLINGRDYLFHRANGDFEW
ncbi:transcription factor IIA subunit alpha [Entomortierella lignicola]|nr:transcription factor IIA subunit alpha [Entomortierella lignicola]